MWCKAEPGNWPWGNEPVIFAEFENEYSERCEVCDEWNPYC